MTAYERRGWFRVELPEGWVAEEDGETVALHHPERSGVLHVSAMTLDGRKPGERIDVFLAMRAFLRGVGVDVDERRASRISRGTIEIASYEYAASEKEGRTFWRTWFLTNQDVLAMATYNCPEEDRDAERQDVDRVMESLSLTSAR